MELSDLNQELNMERMFENRFTFLENDLLEIDLDLLENDFQVIFVIDEDEYQEKLSKKLIESTAWRKTNVKDYWYRTDPPRAENQWHREICIAQKKHTKSVPQFTWKDDFTRKDQHKFTKQPNKIVRGIAAEFFGVDISLIEFIIQKYHPMNGQKLYENTYKE